MNLANIIGGGMVGVALGWVARLLVLYFISIPRTAFVFAIILDVGSCISGIGVGIAILAGGIGPFGITAEVYSAMFVAVQFFGLWGFAISMFVHVYQNNSLVDTSENHDSNVRIREMQTRGQGDQPLEEADREEGHEHRVGIEESLKADAETRATEREVDRAERKEERREDREERADERRDW